MCFDVSIPIRLICSTDGLLCLRSATTSFWHARCRRGPSTPTDGRNRSPATDVRRNPVLDRPVAGTPRPSMKGLGVERRGPRGQRYTLTKANNEFQRREAGNPRFCAPQGIRMGDACCADSSKARRWPPPVPEFGECRLSYLRHAEWSAAFERQWRFCHDAFVHSEKGRDPCFSSAI